MAFMGVRNCGWIRPNNPGRSPCSASAIEIARPRQRLAHVVTGGRQHGAECEQGGARAAHEQQCGVGQRRLRRGKPGKRAEGDDLHERHDDRDDDDCHDQGKRAPRAVGRGLRQPARESTS